MADISIPGVSDKYKTSSYIDALMQKERIPLTREQESLDRYKEQQSAWRGVNQKMSSLRDSTKTLYSFDNPFNNKLAQSSDEDTCTATAGREAEYGTIDIDVIKNATSDRFLSSTIEKDLKVPQGKYSFSVGEKSVSFQWKGGKITDFINSLNKRSNGLIKASMINVSSKEQAMVFEALKTGDTNNLIFSDDALSFAIENNLVEKTRDGIDSFGLKENQLLPSPEESPMPVYEQDGIGQISFNKVAIINDKIEVNPRNGFAIQIPQNNLENPNERIDFSINIQDCTDITEELNRIRFARPELDGAGSVTFENITINNSLSETALPSAPVEPLTPVRDSVDIYVHNKDNSEIKVNTNKTTYTTSEKDYTVSIRKAEYPEMDGIIIRNRNTGQLVRVSEFNAYDEKKALGYTPVHPITRAGDAIIKYEGITIKRPSNKIDDVIPNVTLNVIQPSEKTVKIDIKPDKDSAKDALIKFVGSYNQVVAEMNILSENKPEIISELDYMTQDEQDAATQRLGMFQGDFSLTNGKATMRNTIGAKYSWSENATITMLSQIGISSRASGNNGGSYNASQLRGYLEIDEKKLDENLENNLDEIKNIFGYDADGDLIIDSGIGYQLDKQLTSWVQSGGIIATKNSLITQKITTSENNIKKLESQLDGKEQQLRLKYGQMEGTLNNLNSQANTISNFANNGNRQ